MSSTETESGSVATEAYTPPTTPFLESYDLPQIEGSMPRLDAIPSGCAFHPRCPSRLPRCDRERPVLAPAGATQSACWLTAACDQMQDIVAAAGHA